MPSVCSHFSIFFLQSKTYDLNYIGLENDVIRLQKTLQALSLEGFKQGRVKFAMFFGCGTSLTNVSGNRATKITSQRGGVFYFLGFFISLSRKAKLG